MKNYCSICNEYKKKHFSFPKFICQECCPKIPVETILSILNITYHEALSSTEYKSIKENIIEIDNNKPIFWCTINDQGLFQRCGVCYGGATTLKVNDPNYVEKTIIILHPYWGGETGYRDMKKLKQNFRRIRAGQKYSRY
jgi:hypothetical protein